MAKTSNLGTSIHGQDTQAVETLSNLASIFNPANAADAQQRAAHAEYYRQHGEQAAASKMHALAQAKEIQNRLDANNVEAQVAAGIPRQQAIINVAYGKSATDVATSYNKGRGGDMLASGQGDPNTAAALTGLNPNINSAFTEKQRNDIIAQNSANKIADTVAGIAMKNAGSQDKVTIIPAGSAGFRAGENVPFYTNEKTFRPQDPARTALETSAEVVNGQNFVSSLFPKMPKDQQAYISSQAVLANPGMASQPAITKYMKDNNIDVQDKGWNMWWNGPKEHGQQAIMNGKNISDIVAGGMPAVMPVAPSITPATTGGQSAPAVNAPVSKIGMLDENARATARQRIQANPALRTDFDTKFGAGASDELLAK